MGARSQGDLPPHPLSRRRFLARAGGGLLAAGLAPPRASSVPTLRILAGRSAIPGYDRWFDDELAADWGRRNGTRVVVDRVPAAALAARAAAEIEAGAGHDLVFFPSPPARFASAAIDHGPIYREVARRQGQVVRLGHRSTFDPRAKRYFAFADGYVPLVVHFRRDLWTRIGYPWGPSTYESLLLGGERIRRELGVPCALGIGPEPESDAALLGLLWSFGAAVQDEEGRLALDGERTVAALDYARTLAERAGTATMFDPGAASDTALLDGAVSATVDGLDLARRAEAAGLGARFMLAPAPRGPRGWIACPRRTRCAVVWRFAANAEGAKAFLVALADRLGESFVASRSCLFPCFPKTVPDLRRRLENDAAAEPSYEYAVAADALFWTRAHGHPGYATSLVAEALARRTLARMFDAVARGTAAPAAAAAAAAEELRGVADGTEA